MALVTPIARSGIQSEVRAALTRRDRNVVGLLVQLLMLLSLLTTMLILFTLLGQVFVKDESHKQTIAQLLKAKEASVVSFTLFVVGEGIAKRANDFAAEVAAQAAAAAQK